MNTQRLSWIVTVVVVLTVGTLVVRSLRGEKPAEPQKVAETPQGGTVSQSFPWDADSLRGPDLWEYPSSTQEAQAELKKRGYYDGKIDGGYDPVLRAAIQRFQKDIGMPEDGYLTERVFRALGIQVHGKRKT